MRTFLPSVYAVLTTTPDRWIGLSETIPGDLFSRPPAPGEWSALECLQHLVDAERWVFPKRVRCLLRGEDFPAYDPDSQGTAQDVAQLAAALAEELLRLRKDSLALLDTLTPADLGRQGRHQELGSVTLQELLNEWAGHDLMHTVQAERAMMQPFIQACGPWRSYFLDHLVAENS